MPSHEKACLDTIGGVQLHHPHTTTCAAGGRGLHARLPQVTVTAMHKPNSLDCAFCSSVCVCAWGGWGKGEGRGYLYDMTSTSGHCLALTADGQLVDEVARDGKGYHELPQRTQVRESGTKMAHHTLPHDCRRSSRKRKEALNHKPCYSSRSIWGASGTPTAVLGEWTQQLVH